MDSGVWGVDVLWVGAFVVGGGKVSQDVFSGDEQVVLVVVEVLLVAAEWVVFGVVDHLGGYWVLVDVFADVYLVVDVLDEAGFESPFKEVAGEFVFAVEVLGVFGVDFLHDETDVGGLGFDEQVGVVGHEAVGVQFERVFVFDLEENALVGVVVFGFKEDDAAAVSSCGDVVHGSGEPDS